MINFIPIDYYTPIFFYFFFFLVLMVFLHSQIVNLNHATKTLYIPAIGTFSLIFTLLYVGLRPLSQEFGDMRVYGNLFEYYREGNPVVSLKDPFFQFFVLTMSRLVNVETFFLICALLYIVPLYLVSKKWFSNYWIYSFLFLTGSLSFWAYGTNGLRNGIATSFFLLGISRNQRAWQILWILLAINFHKSLLLPSVGFAFFNFYNRPISIIKFWFLSIPLSILGGKFFELIISAIGFEDDRLSYLTTEASVEKFSSTGFRWDFLIYSAVAVFSGWYYIYKRNYKDKFYSIIFCTYVFCNACWILVIKANFSNRFAYLSWFMMGVVLIYPLLKEQIFKQQYSRIGWMLLIYFLFTFALNIIF